MNVRKVVAGSVLAGAFGVAGLIGASPAQALGLSVDVNGDGQSFDVGSGATTSQTGNASNNPSLAVSVFGNSSTSASGNASGNTLVAIDGVSSASGNAEGNTLVTVAGVTTAGGNSNGNTALNVGGQVSAGGNTSSVQSVSLCGTELTAQGSITVNPLSGGVC